MNNVISTLAGNNTKSNTPKNSASKIRENTELFNMLLTNLHLNRFINDFSNPFDTCRRTLAIYKKQAIIFHKLNIKLIQQYETSIIKKICASVNELPHSFLPHSLNKVDTDLDLVLMLSNIEKIKFNLSKLPIDEDFKFNFGVKAVDFSDMFYQISALMMLYKLTRSEDETFKKFLFSNSVHEFVYYFENNIKALNAEMYLRSESSVNREYFFALRALAISFVQIQIKKFKGNGIDIEFETINVQDPIWIDRILSTAVDL